MARTTATNFTGGLQFPYATAATDIFKKEDLQTLAQAVDQHDHSAGKGLSATVANASITNAKLGPDVARANLLTNGGMEIWQRGNGPFAGGLANTTDRWTSGSTASDTFSISKDTTNVDSNSGAAAACVFTLSGGAGQSSFYQLLKPTDGYQLAGKAISLSVRVRTSTASAVAVAIGNQSGFQNTSGFHAGSGTYATLTATYTVQATDTLLTIGVRFYASCTAYIDNANLVVGSQPADYAPLHPADELARCQRYYNKLGGSSTGSLIIAGMATGASTPLRAMMGYRPIAVMPTVTKVGTWATSNVSPQPTVSSVDVDGCYLSATSVAAGDAYCLNAGVGYLTVEGNP